MTAEEALLQATEGTTSSPKGGYKSHVPKILYFDGKHLILKYPASKTGRIFRDHIPSWVELYVIQADGKFRYGHSKTIHDCSKGRLTQKRLASLIERYVK